MVKSAMWFIFCTGLLLNMLVFFEECEANDEIDLNLFKQSDYQIKFERVELDRYNKRLIKEISIKTFKYNRTLPVMNGTFIPKIDLGNNLVSIVQVYKFMSNEYRHFPLRFAVNTYKAVAANVAGLGTLMECGNFTQCPYAKGVKYHVCNWYPDPSKFPPLIPDGQFKIEVQVVHSLEEVAVGSAYVTVYRPIPYEDVKPTSRKE